MYSRWCHLHPHPPTAEAGFPRTNKPGLWHYEFMTQILEKKSLHHRFVVGHNRKEERREITGGNEETGAVTVRSAPPPPLSHHPPPPSPLPSFLCPLHTSSLFLFWWRSADLLLLISQQEVHSSHQTPPLTLLPLFTSSALSSVWPCPACCVLSVLPWKGHRFETHGSRSYRGQALIRLKVLDRLWEPEDLKSTSFP